MKEQLKKVYTTFLFYLEVFTTSLGLEPKKNVYFSLPFCGGPKMPGVVLMKTSTFLNSQISKATSVKCCIEGFDDTALVLKNLHYGIDGLLSLCLHPDSPKSLKGVAEFQKFFIQIFVSP